MVYRLRGRTMRHFISGILLLILGALAVPQVAHAQWPPEIKMSPEVKDRGDWLWPKLGLG